MRRLHPSQRILAALLVAVSLILAACTKPRQGGVAPTRAATPSATSGASTSPAAAPPITFSNCTGQFQTAIGTDRAKQMTFGCAKVAVPLDYQQPNGRNISLFVVKMHLERQQESKRIGSLLMNPGGPGASGINYAASLVSALSPSLLEHFDLVGFDPRGVGLSSPIECISAQQKDTSTAQDADVRTATGRAEARSLATAVTRACVAKYGESLKYYNTEDTARDMDRIRAALDEQKLNYLGYSYGTRLGAAYAHLFPGRLRTAVLDGALDPVTPELAVDERQAQGFEKAFDQFAADCATRPSCAALGPARAVVETLIREATARPIPSSKKSETRRATGGVLITAIASALYDPDSWKQLGAALLAARNGDSAGLFALADAYNLRDPQSGKYTSNWQDAYTAINCNDSTLHVTDALVAAKAREWTAKYPIFGNNSASALYNCYGWPRSGHPVPPASAPGSPPILVIGSVHDPATPYASAGLLARALGSGVLLTWNGEGHTAYPKTPCVSTAVDNYLISGIVSAATCPAS